MTFALFLFVCPPPLTFPPVSMPRTVPIHSSPPASPLFTFTFFQFSSYASPSFFLTDKHLCKVSLMLLRPVINVNLKTPQLFLVNILAPRSLYFLIQVLLNTYKYERKTINVITGSNFQYRTT